MSGSTARIAATVSSTGLSSFAPPPQMLKLMAVIEVSSPAESSEEHAAGPAANTAAANATPNRSRIRPPWTVAPHPS